jgi:hypothetical protein
MVERLKYDLDIARGSKANALTLEFFAELAVIVDLAIVADIPQMIRDQREH